MKKSILIGLSFIFILTGNSFAQQTGWPSAERHAFIDECVKTAKATMGPDSAKSYCYCMQTKMEQKYPTVEEASKVSDADIASPEWQAEIKNCLSGISGWSSKDRSDFLGECIKSGKEGLGGEEKAKNYCECMMFKMEEKYPNPVDAGAVTEATFQSPEWKKMIDACVVF